MTLNVKERGCHVARLRWIEVRLMEVLAAWVPTTPEMEVKVVFGAHVWDAAQHADALGRRTQELRLPEQHSMEPSAAYMQLLDELAALNGTAERVAGFYECILPGLDSRFREYVSRVDTLLDAPTVRIIDRILADTERMVAEAAMLRDEVPHVSLCDGAWLDNLRQREAGAELIGEPAPYEGVAGGV